MTAKDADLATDYAVRSLYLRPVTEAQFEITGVLAVNQESALPEIFAVGLGALGAGGDAFPVQQPDQKSQFISTEPLDILLPAFLASSGSHITTGADIITLTLKAPDGSILNPAAVWDADVSMWVATVGTGSFQEGEWLLYGVSDEADSLPQFASLWWGDYVDDIPETRQAALGRWKIEGSTLRLYEEDGTTVFKEFSLKDAFGDPTSTSVFDKDPI